MNIKKREWTPYRRIASRLKRLLGRGPVMDGTLLKVDLGSSVRYQLTRKVNGRTKAFYVPLRSAREIADWTDRWREVNELLKEMSLFSRGVFPSVVAKPASKPAGKRGGRGSSGSGAGRPRRNRTTRSC